MKNSVMLIGYITNKDGNTFNIQVKEENETINLHCICEKQHTINNLERVKIPQLIGIDGRLRVTYTPAERVVIIVDDLFIIGGQDYDTNV